MKVAAVQFEPKYGDITGNYGSVVSLAAKAAEQGARLAVFPELGLTGYSIMSRSEAIALEMEQRPHLQTLPTISSELDIAIAVGHIALEDGSLYNAQTLFLPGRGYSVGYHKQNLWGQDWLWAKPGRTNPPIINYEGKSIGLLICADVRDEHPDPWKGELYQAGDADIVAFSSNWGKGAFPATKWLKFVKDNDSALVMGNRYGREANNDFGLGGICVIDRHGDVHVDGLVWGEPCLVLADI